MTRMIVRNIPVQTWGLSLTQEEADEGVAAVTVFAPQGKTVVFVLIECADGTVVGSNQAVSANVAAFDVGVSVARARDHALYRLRHIKIKRRDQMVQRARELAGEAA